MQSDNTPGHSVVQAVDPKLGIRYLYCEGDATLLFTENETNTERIFGVPNRSPYVKDSINDYIVQSCQQAVNPAKKGTKVAAHYRLTVNPGESQTIRLRLSDVAPTPRAKSNGKGAMGNHFHEVLETRRREADEFYQCITPSSLTPDQANVMRQGPCGNAVVQAVLSLRRRQVA